MMKRFISFVAILSIASILTGCCCAPCGPFGYGYGGGYIGGGYVPESCPATAATSSELFSGGDCGSCGTCGSCATAGPVCGPVCPPNYCGSPCFAPCYPCPLLGIIAIPFRVVENLWMCAAGHWPNTGCSQVYWGDWSDPPAACDPCCFNSYAGPCSGRACGATACRGSVGCSSCGCGNNNVAYGDAGFVGDGTMVEGNVIMDSAAPNGTVMPGSPRLIQPTPATTPTPAINTSSCRNCNQNHQASMRPTQQVYRTSYAQNNNKVQSNNGIQQVQYTQSVSNNKPSAERTYAVPTQSGSTVQVPADVMRQLPPGAVIVSDEVVSTQVVNNNAGATYAPVLAPVTSRSASEGTTGWKSAAVNRTQR